MHRRAQPQVRHAVLPPDASCEDIEIDPHLPFLHAFVQAALQNGAAPYIPGASPCSSPPQGQQSSALSDKNAVSRHLSISMRVYSMLPVRSGRHVCSGEQDVGPVTVHCQLHRTFHVACARSD